MGPSYMLNLNIDAITHCSLSRPAVIQREIRFSHVGNRQVSMVVKPGLQVQLENGWPGREISQERKCVEI